MLVASVTVAQTEDKKGLQKVTFGAVVAISANTVITDPIKLPTLGYNLSPNICFVTNRTYHNFLYGIGNNSFKVINGYKPKTDLGIYLALIKSFNSNSGYAGVGVEKFIKAGDVTFFLFSEVGMNITKYSTPILFTVGMHVNIQTPIWKRKT